MEQWSPAGCRGATAPARAFPSPRVVGAVYRLSQSANRHASVMRSWPNRTAGPAQMRPASPFSPAASPLVGLFLQRGVTVRDFSLHADGWPAPRQGQQQGVNRLELATRLQALGRPAPPKAIASGRPGPQHPPPPYPRTRDRECPFEPPTLGRCGHLSLDGGISVAGPSDNATYPQAGCAGRVSISKSHPRATRGRTGAS